VGGTDEVSASGKVDDTEMNDMLAEEAMTMKMATVAQDLRQCDHGHGDIPRKLLLLRRLVDVPLYCDVVKQNV